jgi:hypothetical protein
MSGQVTLVPVPAPIQSALNAKYPATVSMPAVSKVMQKP